MNQHSNFEQNQQQGAFTKGKATDGRIFILYSVILWRNYALKVYTFINFIDFTSFFDTIQSTVAEHEASQNGISSTIIKNIKALGSNNAAIVRTGHGHSKIVGLKGGARQGGRYSPNKAKYTMQKHQKLTSPEIPGVESGLQLPRGLSQSPPGLQLT